MSKFFKKTPAGEGKTARLEMRMSERDADAIRALAFIRCLSVSDFIRRAALGRRADVNIEVEIILSLRKVVQSIQILHTTFVDQGFPPPRDELGIVTLPL